MRFRCLASSSGLSGFALAALLALAMPTLAAVPEPASGTDPVQATEPGSDAKAPPALEISIPTIEADGSNVSEDVLRAIFNGDIAAHAAELAGLNAREIRIPEIRIKQVVPGGNGPTSAVETVYHDIAVKDVVDGVAQSSSMGSADVLGEPEVSFHFGKASTGLLDIRGLLAFYRMIPVTETQERRTLYKDIFLEGGTLSTPKFKCTIREIKAAEFKARPMKGSYTDMMSLAKEMEAEAGDVSPDTISKFISFYADFFDSFESSPTYSSGFDCAGTGEDGEPFVVGVGSLTVGAFTPGHYPEIAAGDIKVDMGAKGQASIGQIRFKGFDYSGPLKTLIAANGQMDEAWAQEHYRELIPSFEGLAFSDVKMDVVDEQNGRVKASVGNFDLTLGAYVNGVPTDISSSATHVAFTVPDDIEDDSIKQLKALGIDTVDVGYEFAGKWDRAAGEIKLDKLAVHGVDLGAVGVKAAFGNAPGDLFSTDTVAAMTAVYGLTLKRLDVFLEDHGFTAKYLAAAAAGEGEDPAKYRTVLSGQVRGNILSLLGGSEAVQALSDAVGSFIDKGGSLSISLAAKDGAGLSFDALQALMADPGAIVDQLDVNASAKGPQ